MLLEVYKHNKAFGDDFMNQATQQDSKIFLALGTDPKGSMQMFTHKVLPKKVIIEKLEQLLAAMKK